VFPESFARKGPDMPDAPALAAYVALRERIKPYVLEAFRQAHETGLPVMRPLFVEFSDDGRAWQVCDAYLLGREFAGHPFG
jgi:alpha-D-xyloside xylohydrolase